MHCFGAKRPEEKPVNFSRILVGPGEFVNAQRIRANEQAIFFDQKHVGFDARTFLGVDLVLRSAVPFLVEVQQGVVESHPDFATLRVDAKGSENRQQGRRSARFSWRSISRRMARASENASILEN